MNPSTKRARYQRIPDSVLRSPDLSATEVRLYGILLSYCYGRSRECNPPLKVLAYQMQMTVRTITDTVSSLEKAGLIMVRRVSGRRSRYIILEEIPEGICDEKRLGVSYSQIEEEALGKKLGIEVDFGGSRKKEHRVAKSTSRPICTVHHSVEPSEDHSTSGPPSGLRASSDVNTLGERKKEDDSMPETNEQRQDRMERQRRMRQGAHTSIKMTKEISDEGRSRRSAMAGSSSTVEKKKTTSKIPNPWETDVVPSTSTGLARHFELVVLKHFPDAVISHDNVDYKWCKELLKQFSTEDLYEMIMLLVLDWPNITQNKAFFPPASGNPKIKQLYSWRKELADYINGKGVTSGPAHRHSAYAEDWRRRNDSGSDSDDSAAEALRRQIRDDV